VKRQKRRLGSTWVRLIAAVSAYLCPQAMERVRVDKWLWAARFFKTRSAATEAVVGGRVHVNGTRAKPAKEVTTGDTIEITIQALKRTVQVAGVSDKRGPAAAASMLYAETPESMRARQQDALERRLARPIGADLGERPSKRDRRRLEALRRADQHRRSR
jgi:ribosome-associated heat shock protein Hsp15